MNKLIIERAAYSAEMLYRNGAISKARVADWIVAESNVRARAKRKGKELTPRQIQRRVRNRLAWRGIGKAAKIIAASFIPAGRPVFNAVTETIEQAITEGIRRANSELEQTS